MCWLSLRGREASGRHLTPPVQSSGHRGMQIRFFPKEFANFKISATRKLSKTAFSNVRRVSQILGVF
jgi:hypothetical protein